MVASSRGLKRYQGQNPGHTSDAVLSAIWHPLIARATKQRDRADLFIMRVTIAWRLARIMIYATPYPKLNLVANYPGYSVILFQLMLY